MNSPTSTIPTTDAVADDAAGLLRAGDGLHDPAVAQERDGVPNSLPTTISPPATPGGIVRLLADRGRADGAVRQRDLEQPVRRLVRDEHRSTGRGQLQVADRSGQRDRTCARRVTVGSSSSRRAGSRTATATRVGLGVVDDALGPVPDRERSFRPARPSWPGRSPVRPHPAPSEPEHPASVTTSAAPSRCAAPPAVRSPRVQAAVRPPSAVRDLRSRAAGPRCHHRGPRRPHRGRRGDRVVGTGRPDLFVCVAAGGSAGLRVDVARRPVRQGPEGRRVRRDVDLAVGRCCGWSPW